jgi:hypothetical protein
MRSLAVLILLAPPQDAKSRYLQAHADQMQYFWETRLELADWARANGLNEEARTLLEFMVRNIAGSHPLKSKAETRLKGSWKRNPTRADAKRLADYQERLRDYYRETADRAFVAYRHAKRAGLGKEARKSLDDTIEYFLDHEEGRRERGEAKVEGFGWVPERDAEVARRNLVEVEKLPEDDATHGTWENAWVVRSKHYLMRSDLPPSRIRAVIDLLEKFYPQAAAFVEGEFQEPPLPLGVYFFRSREDFDAVRQGLRRSFEGIAFYHGMTNLVYLHSFEAAPADEAVLLHECVHQYLDRAAEGTACSYLESLSSRADVADNYWIVEGIAVTLAAMGRESPVRRAAIPKLAEFCALSYEEFLRKGHENYAAAHLLCRYLIERDKAKFVRFLREYYRGNGTTANLTKTLGASLEEIEKGFREWALGYGAAARGVTFPPAAELEEARRKGEAHRAVVGIVTDRAVWARALQAVDERTGLFDGTVEVEVRFGALEGRQAEGAGEGGKGRIVLDLRQLAEYWKRSEELREAVRQGQTWSVPPARLEGVLTHELAHCFQGDGGPDWVREGLATYAAQDFHFAWAWRRAKEKAGDIEAEVEPRFVFARAWAFFEHLREKHGAEAPRRFAALVVRKGKTPSEAAREVTGVEWDDLKRDELRWSAEWLSNVR